MPTAASSFPSGEKATPITNSFIFCVCRTLWVNVSQKSTTDSLLPVAVNPCGPGPPRMPMPKG